MFLNVASAKWAKTPQVSRIWYACPVQQALWHPVKLDTSSGSPLHHQEDDGNVASMGQSKVLTFDPWLPLSMPLGPLRQLICRADGLKEILVQGSHTLDVRVVREANLLLLKLLFYHRGEEGGTRPAMHFNKKPSYENPYLPPESMRSSMPTLPKSKRKMLRLMAAEIVASEKNPFQRTNNLSFVAAFFVLRNTTCSQRSCPRMWCVLCVAPRGTCLDKAPATALVRLLRVPVRLQP